jgi:hypothetical protein
LLNAAPKCNQFFWPEQYRFESLNEYINGFNSA